VGLRPQGNPQDFTVQQRVRYRPGTGTYGFEEAVEEDGRIPATVIGHSPTRVRIAFDIPMVADTRRRRVERAVDAASLIPAQDGAETQGAESTVMDGTACTAR